MCIELFTADGKASEATIRKEQTNPPNNSSSLHGIHFKYTKMEIFVEGKVKKCFKYIGFFSNFNYMKYACKNQNITKISFFIIFFYFSLNKIF